METWEINLNLVYLYDKTLDPTVDLSGLPGPPGSSLHWSITQVKFWESNSMGINQNYGNGNGNMGNLPKLGLLV